MITGWRHRTSNAGSIITTTSETLARPQAKNSECGCSRSAECIGPELTAIAKARAGPSPRCQSVEKPWAVAWADFCDIDHDAQVVPNWCGGERVRLTIGSFRLSRSYVAAM